MAVTNPHVSVLGAGSFGTAMATAMARSGFAVDLYCRTPEQSQSIRESGENQRYFPGYRLRDGITATSDLDLCLAADVICLAFPARNMDGYARQIGAAAKDGAVVINLVKGLHEQDFTFAALFAREAPQTRYVALKGPTFARPLFLGEWSGLTCGTASEPAREMVERLVAGAPVALDFCASAHAVDAVSAMKNVYAIVLGLSAAVGSSENTTYLLVTLILKEMRAILEGLDYPVDAMMSYAGVGDTLLTGLCDTSRNRTLGLMLGKGIPIDPLRSNFLAEGARAVSILRGQAPQVQAPLLDAVLAILENEAPPMSIFNIFSGRNA